MSKIRHILSVIHHTIRGAVCFQFTHFPCAWENIYTLSDCHHQIGSMNYYPFFMVRSLNNGVRCMSFCILLTTWSVQPWHQNWYCFCCHNIDPELDSWGDHNSHWLVFPGCAACSRTSMSVWPLLKAPAASGCPVVHTRPRSPSRSHQPPALHHCLRCYDNRTHSDKLTWMYCWLLNQIVGNDW